MSRKDKFNFKFNKQQGNPQQRQGGDPRGGGRPQYDDEDSGHGDHDPRRYVITGGAGFIGSQLARKLQESEPQAEIIIIDDFRSGSTANLSVEGPDGWSFRGEVISRPLVGEMDWFLGEFLEEFEPDAVFHLAAITGMIDPRTGAMVKDEGRLMRDNVEPFVTMAYMAAELGFKLVYASSAATYGTSANGAVRERRPFKLEDAGRPANAYGFSKWTMENIAAKTLQARSDTHVVGLRFFNVFGPGENHKGPMASMVHQLAHQMLDGKRPRIFTDGSQSRDQVHVHDVVDAILASAKDGVRPGVYNVGSGKATTFNQIVAALNEALGTSLEPDYFANPYAFTQDYTCADLTLTTQCLRWSPRREPHAAMVEYARQIRKAREAGR